MPQLPTFSIDVNLPVVPEVFDKELFVECLKIYNAIRSLAIGVDDYTDSGTLAITLGIGVDTALAEVNSLRNEVAELKDSISGLLDVVNWAQPGTIGSTEANTVDATTVTISDTLLVELTSEFKKKVVTLEDVEIGTELAVLGAVGFNGASPSPPITLPADATDLPSVITLANELKALTITFKLGA